MLKKLLLIAAALLPVPAMAQGLPDLGQSVTEADQIGRAAQASLDSARPEIAEGEAGLPGEAGVFLLTVNEIFYLSGNASLGYTDNPERNADNVGSDGFGEASLTAGLSTRLGETVDFGIGASVGGREFFDRAAASNRNVSGNISAGVPVVGPVYFGVVGFGGWNFDNDFENPVAFYGMGANLSAAFALSDRVVVRPGVAVNRQYSQVAENNSTTVSGGLEAFFAATPQISLGARAGVSRRWFDNFYEDVTFVERKDWNYSLSASASWRPLENVTLGISAGYERQDSAFFLSSYEAFESAASVNLSIRF